MYAYYFVAAKRSLNFNIPDKNTLDISPNKQCVFRSLSNFNVILKSYHNFLMEV